ncbi:STAS domain-containing protein [Streptomyces diacarni]|uniref:Anti-sigma factor antagonist n=2 Tax=Streptomyces TaxID=1883 RepID=A0A367EI56_9ACTN|nr:MULTISPECIES: STAS domain-containing protein [Streptomyces]RCG16890.1 STAS domain-containing protein [Streptomyces diacarni]UNS97771.1 STAS domain-containing protein [Streptomyces tubbatahanensis]
MVAVPRPDAPEPTRFRIVRARGELDIATLPELETDLVRAFGPPGPPRVVLDMRKVTFLDCSVVRVLMRARGRALSRDGSLVLVCAHVPVGRLLRQLELEHRLPAYASVDDACCGAQVSR